MNTDSLPLYKVVQRGGGGFRHMVVTLQELAEVEYWPLRERFPGYSVCIWCEEPFTEQNPCWNSYISYPDGTHSDGTCKRCSERYADAVQRYHAYSEPGRD